MSQPFSFTGDASELSSAISRLIPIIPARTTLPVLSCIRLRIEDSGVWAAATNMEQTLEVKLPVSDHSGNENAGCCIAARRFAALLTRASGEVFCEMREADTLAVVADSARANIKTLAVDEFPETGAQNDSQESEEIEIPELAKALEKVAFAASKDPTRYVLQGVHFNADRGKLVACDNRIAATQTATIPDAISDQIVPNQSVSTIIGFRDSEEPWTAIKANTGFILECESARFWSNVIAATYPNAWHYIEADKSGWEVTSFDKDEALQALAWIRSFQAGSTHLMGSAVVVDFEDSEMRLSVSLPEQGDVSQSVVTGQAISNPGTACLNTDFLISAIKHNPKDEVRICLNTENGIGESTQNPVYLEDQETGWLCLVMSRRIQ